MTTITVDTQTNATSPTNGIQEAVDALPASGGRVHVPAGRYELRQSIRLRDNVTLIGDGAATVLQGPRPVYSALAESTKAHSNRIRLENASAFNVGDQIWIRDFNQGGWRTRYMIITTIEGSEIKGDIIFGDLTRSYEVIERAWAGTFLPAIWAREAHGVTVQSLTIDGGDFEFDPDHTGDFVCAAIHTRNAVDIRISDINIRRWPSDGIGVQGGSGIVTRCIVEDCLGSGFHPGTSISQSIWRDNVSRRNRKGFYFCKNVRNCIVANNIIIQNKEQGIWGLGDPDRYNIVTGNIIAENGQYGLEARHSTGNVIAVNLVRENSRSAPGAFPGIHLEQHARNLVATNLCLDDQDKPTQANPISSINPQDTSLIEGNLSLAASTYWMTWEKAINEDAQHQQWKREQGISQDDPTPDT